MTPRGREGRNSKTENGKERPILRLGISACLLGEPVRYDGGHKLDRFLVETLGRYVQYVPVCPEVECGLPVPREAMRLVGDPRSPHLVTIRSGVDHTDRLKKWAAVKVEELAAQEPDGFIFKSGSPSSGMERVKVYGPGGVPEKMGVGLFAAAFMARFPLLPVEDEGRLNDPAIRERFIEAIFTLRRWRETLRCARSIGGLVDFHTRHKLLILSHSRPHHQEMGRLVAASKGLPRESLLDSYQRLLMEAMGRQATVKKHTDVLMHAMGYFRKLLTSDEKAELLEIIEGYRKELIPLIVPVTLLNHYVRKYDEPYLKQQVYLNPHPLELKLRNHA